MTSPTEHKMQQLFLEQSHCGVRISHFFKMKWDLDSPVTFKADGHTVHNFDRRFQMEEDGVVPMDRTFRWHPVENYVSMFDILRGEGL